MEKGIAYNGLPFPGTGCPVLGVVNIYLYEMSNVWATVSIFVHLPMMLLSTDFLIENRIGIATMEILYIIFTY